ncbi:MAG: GMC family oxidoreductase [Candidatus Latescibacteria bacterium]|nr:GMC family oxidoreductase [Candidatus Latescibacterota bacterium]
MTSDMAMALPTIKIDRPDVIVIGTGAAGGVMMKELSTRGLKVVAFEMGPFLKTRDYVQDELKCMKLRGLIKYDQPNTYRPDANTEPAVVYSVNMQSNVGGGTVHYTGISWRLHESDFKERSLFGPVAGADVQDWPVDYWDLEPYYEKAEYEIGVSGLASANPFDPPRRKPYPLPPVARKSSGALADLAAQKLGWHSYPTPMAIITQDYDSRGACMNCGFCEGYGCTMEAKSSTLVTVIPKALRTGKCEIRADCCVREITVDEQGLATGVVYLDKNLNEHRLEARVVVVCCNGVFTPRLLLMSPSTRFPNGLANSSGYVGKHLMFNYYQSARGFFEKELNEYKGVMDTRVIQDFYEPNPGKHGFFGGGVLEPRGDGELLAFSQLNIPRLPRWGPERKQWIIQNFNRQMVALASMESLSQETNTVSLDAKVKDKWGLPVPCITYKSHPNEFTVGDFFRERAKELLAAAGATRIVATPNAVPKGDAHLLGTCRMGNDPRTSVVNKFNQSHDVKNLFLVDGSSFVTSGKSNPTLTIQALSFRAAEYIVDQMKKGNIG